LPESEKIVSVPAVIMVLIIWSAMRIELISTILGNENTLHHKNYVKINKVKNILFIEYVMVSVAKRLIKVRA
jgi:hypothetical protein